MPAARPPLARKVTSKTEAARQSEADAATTSIKVDGVVYTVRMAEVSGRVERDFRRATGLSVMGVLNQMATDPGVDSLAAFIWLAKIQRGDEASFEDELTALTWNVEVDYAPEGEPAPAPEA